MTCNQYSDIDKKVVLEVQGKHARIAFIVPPNPPTYDELVDLHRTIAEIQYKQQTRIKSKEEQEAATEL